MWDRVPQLRIEPRTPALGARSLSHWTTREVPETVSFMTLPSGPPTVEPDIVPTDPSALGSR